MYYLSRELPDIYNALNNDITCLLPIFEKLLKCEDTSVRDSSSTSMIAIISNLKHEQIQTVIYPFIIGLLESDWFTGKCSASGLFMVTFIN